MNNQKIVNAYLNRFDKILNEMAKKMLNQKITNNITINFIICMIPHHQAAIYMSQNLLRFTNYKPLQKVTIKIIETQTNGIRQMQEILKTTPNFQNSKEAIYKYMTNYFEITKDMIFKMNNSLRTNDINLDFTSEMIPHHEGAIKMCQNLLNFQIDKRLRIVAEKIIKEQSMEVRELMKIRQELIKRK